MQGQDLKKRKKEEKKKSISTVWKGGLKMGNV